MNDRVSKRPPSIYIKDIEPFQTPSNESQANPASPQKTRLDGAATFYDAGIENTKPSGMYRFGRALVNAFKPKSVWRGFGNNRDEKDPSSLAEKIVMHERQLMAEKAYAELKKNGYKGTQQSARTVESVTTPVVKKEPGLDESRDFLHREANVHVTNLCSSTEQERNEKVTEHAVIPIPLVPVSAAHRLVSPMSNASSARKSSLYFRKPSFPNLKKAKSQIHLPAIKKHVPAEPGAGIENVVAEQDLRKQPSRKDIAKQEKLSKKVSDLEIQLEIARRNLKRSMHEGPADSGIQYHKGSRVFKPGALSSLPSERLLNKDLDNANGSGVLEAEAKDMHESLSERQAVLRCAGDRGEPFQANSTSPLKKENIDPFNQHNSCKKRSLESRHEQDIPSVGEYIDVSKARSNTTESERPKRNLRSSSKMKDNVDTSAGAYESGNQGSILPAPRGSSKKALETVPPLPPLHNLHTDILETVPPLPTAHHSFDSPQVDHARLLSMRSIGDMKTPFGRHPDDLANLRKEFPMASARQLALYINNLSKESKITDHTSLAHHNQVVVPPLARPRSLSPLKIEPRKASKGRKSPLQTSHHNGNSVSKATDMDLMERRASGAIDLTKPPVQLSVSSITPTAAAKKVENEKPLPTIQKEDYEWPDDVF